MDITDSESQELLRIRDKVCDEVNGVLINYAEFLERQGHDVALSSMAIADGLLVIVSAIYSAAVLSVQFEGVEEKDIPDSAIKAAHKPVADLQNAYRKMILDAASELE